MKKMMKNRKGFTLMEMLIVVAIIAILVIIAIPTFNSALAKAPRRHRRCQHPFRLCRRSGGSYDEWPY